MSAKPKPIERPEHAAGHCLTATPYRMVVFAELSQHKVPLYFVAGSAAPARSAKKALQEAFRVHGGTCFYCRQPVAEGQLSIDHAEPVGDGGTDHLQNLLISCTPCNRSKARQPIEAYNPQAGREWLSALLKQVQGRLNRLNP